MESFDAFAHWLNNSERIGLATATVAKIQASYYQELQKHDFSEELAEEWTIRLSEIIVEGICHAVPEAIRVVWGDDDDSE
jgi:hypothetical protein